jgi:hypothetical protein
MGTMLESDLIYNILEIDDEIVKEFRKGLMSRIAKRPKIEQEMFFEKLVRSVIQQGEIDITGWNRDAISILLKVCAESGEEYHLINDGLRMSFLRYPQGAIFDALAEAIISGELLQN